MVSFIRFFLASARQSAYIRPMSERTPEPISETKAPPFAEFVALIAMLMALGALGIDAILPALPTIGKDLSVDVPNHLQWLISIYFLGMGAGQLTFGILSDWLGRKRILIGGVMLYVVFALVAAFVHDFGLLLVIRLLQGFAVSTSGVVTRSIIRDLYSGAKMAKVTSISLVVFLLVPILAPSFGQLVLLVAPWPVIFLSMAAFGVIAGVWAWLRLPETHPPEKRRKPDLGHLRRVAFFVVTEPGSLYYTLGITFLIGSLLAYVSLMPQIFEDVFRRPELMAGIFAACAATMGGASILNASIVERLGTKRISHTALIGFIAVSLIHLAWTLAGLETILSFVILQSLTMGLMSLTTSNFGAMAMEKVGHVAGTASSLQGVVSTIGAGIISGLIGQAWTGGIWLLPLGAAGCGFVALAFVALNQRSRLVSSF
ncbi:drug resistance transporter, Bcr/CflA subfamily protein [Asticcacaulis biprosthecium C19]|uniref:Bcr/CflA family efflux transporter n=2 Tax=Asticcacaulis biprosthecium TaxID=76891 RepID=F4QLF9_9CAUL|nr:drug resistance transporter, Bcr/CflA subfamily protein [Asticcacaulis biprosthecium C19]